MMIVVSLVVVPTTDCNNYWGGRLLAFWCGPMVGPGGWGDVQLHVQVQTPSKNPTPHPATPASLDCVTASRLFHVTQAHFKNCRNRRALCNDFGPGEWFKLGSRLCVRLTGLLSLSPKLLLQGSYELCCKRTTGVTPVRALATKLAALRMLTIVLGAASPFCTILLFRKPSKTRGETVGFVNDG